MHWQIQLLVFWSQKDQSHAVAPLATLALQVQLFISTYEVALPSAPRLNTAAYLANEKNFCHVPQITHAVFHFLTFPLWHLIILTLMESCPLKL